jgi:hypothetical protein
VTARRWDFEMPGQQRDHRRHEQMSVLHRRDWRGRPRLAARLCLTCRLILREWKPCGVTVSTGHPCLRPAVHVWKHIYRPCDRHDAVRMLRRAS